MFLCRLRILFLFVEISMEKPVGDLRLVLGRKYHFTGAVSRQGPLILAAPTE